MKRFRAVSRAAIVALLALSVATCGDDGGSSGPPLFVGTLIVPPPGQCSGCSVSGVSLAVQQLRQDAPPQTVATVTTDAGGNYDTGQLAQGLLGSGVILVANVNPNTGAGIGGVESPRGGRNEKDFDVTTQIACVASVFLTAGPPPSAPCTVSPTQDPALIDNQRIEILEEAASFIADRAVLPDDEARGACAVIVCTAAGGGRASPECVNGLFDA